MMRICGKKFFLSILVLTMSSHLVFAQSTPSSTATAAKTATPSATTPQAAAKPAATTTTPAPVPATTQQQAAPKPSTSTPQIPAPRDVNTATITYAPTNFESMTKLAWALGAYDYKDIPAVNHFLQITECNLYHKFFENEFEWTRVTKSTQNYLQNYSKDVPRYYEFVQPIAMKRYDFNLKGFPLDDTSSYDSTYVLQISDNQMGRNSCGDRFENTDKYPITAVLKIKSPFSLSFIHVPEDLAREYLSFISREESLKGVDARPAYLRFQVQIVRLLKIEKINNTPYFVFDGKLLRMDAFADSNLLLPLYTQKF